ncbi:MAG: site-specific integrase [Frankiales bacterium]|nr:site-specific integrase [Frankiales bacterium]
MGSSPTRPTTSLQVRGALRSRRRHIRFHHLRHTHASLALQAGVSAKVVSDRLGHSTVAFTLDVYLHVVPALQEEAVASLFRRA